VSHRQAIGRTFVLETLASTRADGIDAGVRLGGACDGLRAGTGAIAYLGALVVPEDELILHLVEAGTVRIVRRAASEAGLATERLVESLAVARRRGRAIRIPVAPYPNEPVAGAPASAPRSATIRASSVRDRIPSLE
jgi:hypothetical protein